MRKIKEVLRLRYACGLSLEQIARAQNLSKGVVAKYLKRAAAAGIDGTTAQTLDEADLAQRLKPSNDTPRQSSFTAPDFASIHQALKHKSVTLQLLWHCHLYGGRTTATSVLIAPTVTPASASNIERLPRP